MAKFNNIRAGGKSSLPGPWLIASVLAVFLNILQSGFSLDGLWSQFFFRRSDLPYIPGVDTSVLPAPPFVGHYFGDLLHVLIVDRFLDQTGYFGASAIFVHLLNLTSNYTVQVTLFLIVAVASLALVARRIAQELVNRQIQKRSAYFISFLVVFSFPNLYAIMRGQMSLFVTLGLIYSIFLLIICDDRDSKKPLLSLTPLIIFSLVASMKIYPFGFILLIASLWYPNRMRQIIGAISLFFLLLISPALYHSNGILFFQSGGDSNYFTESYFEIVRDWNYSIQKTLVRLSINDFFGPYSGIALTALLSALIWLLAAHLMRSNCPVSTMFALFAGCVAAVMAIPIAAPYTLGVFVLPLLADLYSKLPSIHRFSEFDFFTQVVRVFVILSSIFFLLPTQLTIELSDQSFLLGPELAPYLALASTCLIFVWTFRRRLIERARAKPSRLFT